MRGTAAEYLLLKSKLVLLRGGSLDGYFQIKIIYQLKKQTQKNLKARFAKKKKNQK